MRDLLLTLFSEHNSDAEITLYSGWHFLYLFLIFGTALTLSVIFRHRSARAKHLVTSIFAYLTIGLYLVDFFIMPLCDSYGYEVSIYKLPFNICTLMAVLVPLVQFDRHLSRIRPVVVMLSITSSMMWMVYPGTALGGQPPFCYLILQTFVYHGFLFNWGCLSIALGETKVTIKNCWQDFFGILVVFVWARLGNSVYPDWNWFFIEESIFPFVSNTAMPIVTICGIFAVLLGIYGIYYAFSALFRTLDRRRERKNASCLESNP